MLQQLRNCTPIREIRSNGQSDGGVSLYNLNSFNFRIPQNKDINCNYKEFLKIDIIRETSKDLQSCVLRPQKGEIKDVIYKS